MSIYVMGDIQGCRAEFNALLDRVQFDESRDWLWLTGDLINRGPDNLGLMDQLLTMKRIVTVLGNHDLHFLAVARGHGKLRKGDTLADLLSSPRLDEYIEFFRQQPLIHHDASESWVMVHAGLPPQLSLETCLALAREVEAALQGPRLDEFLSAMYGNEPAIWDEQLDGMARLRVITNYFTRMRYCSAEGELEMTHKGTDAPAGYAPWFSFERAENHQILFGHWAWLEGKTGVDFAHALDTGCVWGRSLTAMRLEDGALFSVPAQS